jgi:hypothetical protein
MLKTPPRRFSLPAIAPRVPYHAPPPRQRKPPPPPNQLTALRDATHMTTRRLSVLLDVSQSTVWRWETCAGAIPDGRKEEVADIFGVTVAHLMGWYPLPDFIAAETA